MIVVDTSALFAIAAGEPAAGPCLDALDGADDILLSAGSLAEALIVASGRGLAEEMVRTIDEVGLEIVPVTAAAARRIGMIYRRWGRGFHRAALNLGDCFAYELATSRNCPLLFVGEDFARTDVKRAITAP